MSAHEQVEHAGSTLADIFKQHGAIYRNENKLATVQYQAMRAIENCRTAKLGGHTFKCDCCNEEIQMYNSCRNRHCPQCQSYAKAKWLDDRKKECLPIEYFHVVFTLPHELNLLAQCNHSQIYALLFKAAWHALNTLGLDCKYLGGQMGMIGILHTWGQNLSQHIHLHCVVPGGALVTKSGKWIMAKPGYLFPVKALSKLFRGYYIYQLQQSLNKKQINMHQSMIDQMSFIKSLWKHDWVVYSKKPFNGPKSVLEYLSRYTHKVAITNNRVISHQDGQVGFRWRDYAHGNKNKVMRLSVQEFIRRFMLHILPKGFVRIRHFGFFKQPMSNKKTYNNQG